MSQDSADNVVRDSVNLSIHCGDSVGKGCGEMRLLASQDDGDGGACSSQLTENGLSGVSSIVKGLRWFMRARPHLDLPWRCKAKR